MGLFVAVLLLIAVGAAALAAARARQARQEALATFDAGPGARCGACGYDTTGLTGALTCPECGGDLRRVGIRRQPPAARYRELAGAALALIVVWVICGLILMMAVIELFPKRSQFNQNTVLEIPGSRAYGALAVVATGTGWEGRPVPVRVRIELRQFAPSDALPVPPTVPAPLVIDPVTGTYSYADVAGRPVSGKAERGADAVLAWLAAAGIDATAAAVRDEARAAWLAALRAGRRPRPGATLGGSGGSSSQTSTPAGPFRSVRSSEGSGFVESPWPPAVFGVVWLGVLLIGGIYVSRESPHVALVTEPSRGRIR
jgi:hypothetical protein